MLHQAAHAMSFEPGKVVTTEGRWHGRSYVTAAEKIGLNAWPANKTGRVTGSTPAASRRPRTS
jgi:hypothetical protein